ncbi:hypothetical protein [Staphylococcus aureus]
MPTTFGGEPMIMTFP